MGLGSEVLTGRVTNPGAAFTGLTMNTGDTLAVRSFPVGSPAYLEGVWGKGATAGSVRVRSPRLHDNVAAFTAGYHINSPRNLMPDQADQRLYPQDVLIAEATGGAAETDVAALLVYYQDVPGLDARLAVWEQVLPRVQNILTIRVAVAGAATLGDWSAGTTLTTTQDLLKANIDYAILGYVVQNNVNAIAVRGPDTGNLRVGGPGSSEEIETRNWFVDQSDIRKTPHIPIINAANKGATQVFQNDNAAGATNNVDLIVAELTT